MKTNRFRNYSAGIFWQKYISVLLAAFVFVLSMLGNGTADAAKVTAEEVTRTVTIQPRLSSNETKIAQIKMHVMVENLDLHAYQKYTVELRKNAKYGNVVFAKAAPGSQVGITAEPSVIPGVLSKPVIGTNCTQTTKFYNHKKIGTLKELTSLGKENAYGKKYTIPKDVEEVTATVSLTYHVGMEVGKDMKASTGTYRQEPALHRHYYIFTSDAACKKAYDLMTGSSGAGAISSVLGGDKKSNAKSDGKQTGNTNDSKDSDGMGTAAKVAIGVVAVGAIGFGAFKLLGKGRGGKENGAGKNNNPASTSRNPERFEHANPVAGAQQSGRAGAVRNNNFDGRQPGRTGAAMRNAASSQQTQRAGAAMRNATGPLPTQRTSAAMGNATGPQQTQRAGEAGNHAAEAVTFCMQCGAPLRSTSRFCTNCGAKTAPDFCPNCGEKLEPGSVFCGNCGMRV